MEPKLPAEELSYRRPLAQILADLSRPIPDRFLESRPQGGRQVKYVAWYHLTRLLEFYAPGWEGRVVSIQFQGDLVCVTYEVTIHAHEGSVSRQATGWSRLTEPGDPICAAEQQAFKRACARFGLGLDLYN